MNSNAEIHQFNGKRAASAWLKNQGFVRATNCQGGRWHCGERRAVWVPMPDWKSSGFTGVLVIQEFSIPVNGDFSIEEDQP